MLIICPTANRGGCLMRIIGLIVLATIIAGAGFWAFVRNQTVDLSDLDPYSGRGGSPSDLDPFLESVRDRTSLPAIAASILSPETVIAAGETGLADANARLPLPEGGAWHIGSLTKNMTAILAARLVEEDLIDWDTTPAEIWPDWPADFNTDWRDVPLHRFLRMNAGVQRHEGSAAVVDRWAQSADRSAEPRRQRAEFVEAALSLPPATEPGTQFHYANDSYIIAAHMMEIRTGTAYEQLMSTYLFEPLGLATAGFGPPSDILGHRANGEVVPAAPDANNPAVISPAGRVHLSTADYTRYLQFLLRASRGESEWVSENSMDVLFQPFDGEGEAYAMGWTVRDDLGPNFPIFTHTGSNTYWYAEVWLIPDRDLAVFVFTNQGDTGSVTDAVAWRLVTAELERSMAN